MTFSEFYNFDYNNGKRLAVAEIFDDTTKLSQLNRDAFGKFLTEQGNYRCRSGFVCFSGSTTFAEECRI